MHELIVYVREVCQKKQASKLHVCIMYVYIGMRQANRSMYTYMQVAVVSFFSHQEDVRAPVQTGRPAGRRDDAFVKFIIINATAP